MLASYQPEEFVPLVLQLREFRVLEARLGKGVGGESDDLHRYKALMDGRALMLSVMIRAKKALRVKIDDFTLRDEPLNAATSDFDDKAVRPRGRGIDIDQFRFPLAVGSSPEEWAALRKAGVWRRPVRLTLQTTLGKTPHQLPTNIHGLPTDAEQAQATLQFASYLAIFIVLVVFAAMFVVLIWLAWTRDLLCDPFSVCPDGRNPQSLSRAQMVFWFVLVAGAFLYLLVSHDKVAVVNETSLALLGVGSVTALGAAVIASSSPYLRRQGQEGDDAFKKRLDEEIISAKGAVIEALAPTEAPAVAAARKALRNLEGSTDAAAITAAEKNLDAALEKGMAAAPKATAGGNPSAVQTRLVQLEKQRQSFEECKKRPGRRNPLNRGFTRLMHDWLTEDGSFAVHRFQMFGWTLVLGVVFAWWVLYHSEMPKFDAVLLGLLGITNGTYLGFKLSDRGK